MHTHSKCLDIKLGTNRLTFRKGQKTWGPPQCFLPGPVSWRRGLRSACASCIPIRAPFHVPAAPLWIQLPAEAPGRAAGDGPSPWVPAPKGETTTEFPAPGFSRHLAAVDPWGVNQRTSGLSPHRILHLPTHRLKERPRANRTFTRVHGFLKICWKGRFIEGSRDRKRIFHLLGSFLKQQS